MHPSLWILVAFLFVFSAVAVEFLREFHRWLGSLFVYQRVKYSEHALPDAYPVDNSTPDV